MRRIPFCMPHTMAVSLMAGCGDAHRAQPMTAIRAADGVRDFSSGWRGLGSEGGMSIAGRQALQQSEA